MKHEMLEVLNAIAMMGQNLQMVMSASQSNSCPGPQKCPHQPAGFPSSHRMDCPCPGAAGNSCFMCNETTHFLNHLSQSIPSAKSQSHSCSLNQAHSTPSIPHATGHTNQQQSHLTIPEGSLPVSPWTRTRTLVGTYPYSLGGVESF